MPDSVAERARISPRQTSVTREPVEKAGRSHPLGATLVPGGANFSLFSRSAERVELLLFDREDDARPSRLIHIDSPAQRTYHYRHVFVPGLQAGQIYGYRVYGPFDPASGQRFDPSKVLLDPYGRALAVPKTMTATPPPSKSVITRPPP